MDEYTKANLANWESRVPIHTGAQGYDLQRYLDDPAAISDAVAFDREDLGDLTGMKVLHLQCHIGTDTLSLSRLGAHVTGVDFSPSALEAARELAERTGHDIRYVQASVDDTPQALSETFDLVYTGVGALNWLPSAQRWAEVVTQLLHPGGRLFLRDGHPMAYTLDDERDDRMLVIEYPYFETEAPLRWETPYSYTGSTERVGSPVTYEWNHGLGEVVQAVIDAGMQLRRLQEHTDIDWPLLAWMEPRSGGRYVPPDRPERLPLMYSLEAVKQ